MFSTLKITLSKIVTLFLFLLFSLPFWSKSNDTLITPELTIENVKIAIIDAGIKYPEIVLRQVILETGWLKCTKCSLTKNNIFGFYYKKKYIAFDSWLDSIDYYKRWQERHYKGGDYYQFLITIGYATSPSYVQTLKQIKGI